MCSFCFSFQPLSFVLQLFIVLELMERSKYFVLYALCRSVGWPSALRRHGRVDRSHLARVLCFIFHREWLCSGCLLFNSTVLMCFINCFENVCFSNIGGGFRGIFIIRL